MTLSRCHPCCWLSFGSPGQEACNDIACHCVAECEGDMNTCIRFQGRHDKGAILVSRVHWQGEDLQSVITEGTWLLCKGKQ